MLNPQTIIEELFKWEIFQLILIFHFKLNNLCFFHVFVSYEIFGKVDASYTVVVFQKLC